MRALIDIKDIELTVQKKRILYDINFTIHQNEIITIVGPNGAGKSSLLSIILGLRRPSNGRIIKYNINNQAPVIGFIPQSINRDSTLPINTWDFILLAKKANKHFANQLLAELNLTHCKHQLISELSGGELRKVLFIRALINQPDLLVMDEPTAGLDFLSQEKFYKQLNHLRKTYGFAILMVSHDLHWVMSSTDNVVCLNKHICCMGKSHQIKDNPHYKALIDNEIQQSSMAYYQHYHDHHHDNKAHD